MVLENFVFESTEKGSLIVRLTQGTYRIVSGKLPKKSYAFLTPVATIGIRGTDFVVAVAPNGSTTVSVLDGEVAVSPNGGGTAGVATPGQTISVATPGSQATVQPTAATTATVTVEQMLAITTQASVAPSQAKGLAKGTTLGFAAAPG